MVTLYYGEESYLSNQAFLEAKKQYTETEVYDCFDSHVLESCTTVDLFSLGSKKGIFVRLENLEKNELLEQYVLNPSENSDLHVLAGRVNRSLKVFKAFKNAKEYRRLNPRELKTFVFDYLKGLGATITEGGYQVFIENTGYLEYKSEVDLYEIVGELDNLSLLSSQIDETLVSGLVPNRNADAFHLSGLYMDGRYEELLRAVDILSAKKGFSSIQTLSLMLRNWRCGYQSVRLGTPPAYGTVVRKGMTAGELVGGMEIIADGIRAVKVGRYSDMAALRMVILSLIAKDKAYE